MEFDYYTYNICGHYLSALINGDESGLDETDQKLFDEFIDSLPPVNGHWDVIDEEGSFMRDDVSGLLANCYECRYYFPLD